VATQGIKRKAAEPAGTAPKLKKHQPSTSEKKKDKSTAPKSASKAPSKLASSSPGVKLPHDFGHGLVVEQFGTVEYKRPMFSDESHLFPIGFKSRRIINKHKFYNEIRDGSSGPQFVVIGPDKHEYQGITASAAWSTVLQGLDKKQYPLGLDPNEPVNGNKKFGLANHEVKQCLEALPNASKCRRHLTSAHVKKPASDSVRHAGPASPVESSGSGLRMIPKKSAPEKRPVDEQDRNGRAMIPKKSAPEKRPPEHESRAPSMPKIPKKTKDPEPMSPESGELTD
jgi:hypothetical protein